MAGKIVLIVDDDPDVVAYLGSFLEDHGYEARSAGDAGKALRSLEGFRPDAILVDVLLPGKPIDTRTLLAVLAHVCGRAPASR